MASRSDIQIAALAAGFTLGYGLLTVWEAVKQTRQNRNPLRSAYIYMIWGEVIANLAIGVVGWVFLDGLIGPTVTVLFFILLLWVFEIQLLMQIIINRIALIAENKRTIAKMKWGTVAVISAINVAVFCIWIPAHTVPPASQLYVKINSIWDRTSKVLIMLVDALLNWYFLRTVKRRLLKQHGLLKYQPLVSFNAKLMIVSISMDAMLIGLMSLPNQVVYIQFHPVAYMVKLNVEMSMASLIARLAQGRTENDVFAPHSSTDPRSHHRSGLPGTQRHTEPFELRSYEADANGHEGEHNNPNFPGIHRRTDVQVVVEDAEGDGIYKTSERASSTDLKSLPQVKEDMYDDDIPLRTKHALESTGKRA